MREIQLDLCSGETASGVLVAACRRSSSEDSKGQDSQLKGLFHLNTVDTTAEFKPRKRKLGKSGFVFKQLKGFEQKQVKVYFL